MNINKLQHYIEDNFLCDRTMCVHLIRNILEWVDSEEETEGDKAIVLAHIFEMSIGEIENVATDNSEEPNPPQ